MLHQTHTHTVAHGVYIYFFLQRTRFTRTQASCLVWGDINNYRYIRIIQDGNYEIGGEKSRLREYGYCYKG